MTEKATLNMAIFIMLASGLKCVVCNMTVWHANTMEYVKMGSGGCLSCHENQACFKGKCRYHYLLAVPRFF